jgi:hypothetical protein
MSKFEYEVHEFAKHVPPALPEKFAAIVADIKKTKGNLVEPIVLYEGAILEGNTRYEAVQAAGYELDQEHFTKFEGMEAEAKHLVFARLYLHRDVTPQCSIPSTR